jgi:hypothetical protein
MAVNVVAIICVLIGPYTCFASWIVAFYVLMYGAPVHVLALIASGWAIFRSRPSAGTGLCLASGILGMLMSGTILLVAQAYVGR